MASPKILRGHMIALPLDCNCCYHLRLQFHTRHYYPHYPHWKPLLLYRRTEEATNIQEQRQQTTAPAQSPRSTRPTYLYIYLSIYLSTYLYTYICVFLFLHYDTISINLIIFIRTNIHITFIKIYIYLCLRCQTSSVWSKYWVKQFYDL